MPFRKRTHRRRHVTRRPKKTTRAIAKRGLRIAKTLASNTQRKYSNTGGTTAFTSDTSVTAFALTSTIPQISQLTNTTDTATMRVGDMAVIRSILLKGTFNGNFARTVADSALGYRIIIAQDKQQIGNTAPDITDVLASSPYYISVYNYPDEQKRFKILYDKRFMLNAYPYVAAGANLQATMIKPWEHWVFPTAKKVYWTNGLSEDSPQKNHVWMFVCPLNSGMAPSELTMDLSAQVCFTDA